MCFDFPSVFPFRLSIGWEESNVRMRGCGETLCTRTSDELAMDLLRDAGSGDWQLFPLLSEPDCGSTSLLDCIVTGVLEAVPIPDADKKVWRQQARTLEQQVLQLQHPMPADAAGSGAGHADILAEHPLGDEDSEGSDWQELLADARAIHCFAGAAVESREDSSSRSSSSSRSASDVEEDSAGAAEALEESIFRASVDSVTGAVTSSTPPWNDFPVDWGVFRISQVPRNRGETHNDHALQIAWQWQAVFFDEIARPRLYKGVCVALAFCWFESWAGSESLRCRGGPKNSTSAQVAGGRYCPVV